MFHYEFCQWLSFFYLYCIFGWCFESIQTGLSPHEVANLVEQVQNLTRRVKKYESWEE